MSGTTVILGDHRSPNSTYVQIAGEVLRMDVEKFRAALKKSSTLHAFLLKFAQVTMTQAVQTAVANGRARLDQRMARWLLMAHDRTVDDEVPLTHELLSLMLGVRRAIEVHRGSITLNDRTGIEKIAGHFYGIPEAEYARLIGG